MVALGEVWKSTKFWPLRYGYLCEASTDHLLAHLAPSCKGGSAGMPLRLQLSVGRSKVAQRPRMQPWIRFRIKQSNQLHVIHPGTPKNKSQRRMVVSGVFWCFRDRRTAITDRVLFTASWDPNSRTRLSSISTKNPYGPQSTA